MLKKIVLLPLFCLFLLLQGCDSSAISLVKENPLLPYDNSILVGKLLETYQYISEPEWKEVEGVRGQKLVIFKAKYDVIALCGFLALNNNTDEFKKLFVEYMKDIPVSLYIQFDIATDMKSFKLSYLALGVEAYGIEEMLSTRDANSIDRDILSIYQNKPLIPYFTPSAWQTINQAARRARNDSVRMKKEAEQKDPAELLKIADNKFNEGEYDEATAIYEKLAKQNYAPAQYALGGMYEGADTEISLKWYTKAAEQNYAPAQYALGDFYIGGDHGVKDYKKSLHWLTKAAEQNFAQAQSSLGYRYYKGNYGVSKDYKKAVYWLTKAAEQNELEAQYLLGEIYSNGQGVKQDLSLAKKWYGKACKNDYEEACEQYNKLK